LRRARVPHSERRRIPFVGLSPPFPVPVSKAKLQKV
jgi:hypothetical protein